MCEKDLVIAKIVSLADRYIKTYLTDAFNKDVLLCDWWEGLKFFLGHSFNQGRRDDISQRVQEAALKALGEYFKNDDPDVLLDKRNFDEIRTALEQEIGKGKIGRARDVGMVLSILDFVSSLGEKNIIKSSIKRIENGAIDSHYRELQEKIFSIGPKISSFYLRDLVCFYSLYHDINDKHIIYLQPIDIWVRRISRRIGIIENEGEDESVVKEKIVSSFSSYRGDEKCRNAIKFNQGAWYLGSNSFSVAWELLEESIKSEN